MTSRIRLGLVAAASIGLLLAGAASATSPTGVNPKALPPITNRPTGPLVEQNPTLGGKSSSPLVGIGVDDCAAVYQASERCTGGVVVNIKGGCPKPKECTLWERTKGATASVTPGATCRAAGSTYSASCI